MKKLLIILLSLSLCLLTACGGGLLPKPQDITNVELMRTMALDKGEKKDVLVTVSSAVKAGSEGSEPTPPVVIRQEGNTVYAACLSIQTKGDQYVSFGAVDQCLVSEAAAPKGLPGLLDVLERDYEMRMDTTLFLCEGEDAGKFLEKMATKKTSAADRLSSMNRDYALESEGWPMTVRETLIDLGDNGSVLLPVIRLKAEKEEPTIEAAGMTWLSHGEIRAHLRGEEARSAAILTGRAENGAVEVMLSEDCTAGLSLTSVHCRWKPVWEGEQMKALRCQVSVKADIAELTGAANPEEAAVRQTLEDGLERTLEQQLSELLKKTQEAGEDIFHLRRTLMAQCPLKSGLVEEYWESWYANMNIPVEVSAEVERSYEVSRGSEAA